MMHIILLTCVLGMDPWECQPNTAIETTVLDETASNEIMCGFKAMAMAATFPRSENDTTWTKVICERDRPRKG